MLNLNRSSRPGRWRRILCLFVVVFSQRNAALDLSMSAITRPVAWGQSRQRWGVAGGLDHVGTAEPSTMPSIAEGVHLARHSTTQLAQCRAEIDKKTADAHAMVSKAFDDPHAFNQFLRLSEQAQAGAYAMRQCEDSIGVKSNRASDTILEQLETATLGILSADMVRRGGKRVVDVDAVRQRAATFRHEACRNATADLAEIVTTTSDVLQPLLGGMASQLLCADVLIDELRAAVANLPVVIVGPDDGSSTTSAASFVRRLYDFPQLELSGLVLSLPQRAHFMGDASAFRRFKAAWMSLLANVTGLPHGSTLPNQWLALLDAVEVPRSALSRGFLACGIDDMRLDTNAGAVIDTAAHMVTSHHPSQDAALLALGAFVASCQGLGQLARQLLALRLSVSAATNEVDFAATAVHAIKFRRDSPPSFLALLSSPGTSRQLSTETVNGLSAVSAFLALCTPDVNFAECLVGNRHLGVYSGMLDILAMPLPPSRASLRSTTVAIRLLASASRHESALACCGHYTGQSNEECRRLAVMKQYLVALCDRE